MSDSRISLDSVVYAFKRGASAESINARFLCSRLKKYTKPSLFICLINRRLTHTSMKVKQNLRNLGGNHARPSL